VLLCAGEAGVNQQGEGLVCKGERPWCWLVESGQALRSWGMRLLECGGIYVIHPRRRPCNFSPTRTHVNPKP
jgi:hypothetical protein